MRAAILNQGRGAWAFAELAEQLSAAFDLPVVEEPADLNYLLFWDRVDVALPTSFVPFDSIAIAGDKRAQSVRFDDAGVPAPITRLCARADDVAEHTRTHDAEQWVLKYPIGCGAAGHRVLEPGARPPTDWPLPYLVQEFIEMPEPEVFRLYAAGGETFGWNRRSFPPDSAKRSPWVAHATGARYSLPGPAPSDAVTVGRAALAATGLLDSFGCVDLLESTRGWLALEVGTDGLNNYVDRDVPEPLKAAIDATIAAAFHDRTARPI